MDDIEISRLLKNNCSNKNMANFLNELFIFELVSGGKWTERYNEEINNYYKKEVENED